MKTIKINLFLIALKNLGRHKIKTIITVIAVTISVSLYIFLDAWLYGANIDSQRNIANFEIGSSKIYSLKYFEKKDEAPISELFNNWQPIINLLSDNGFYATPRITFIGSLLSKDNEIPFQFIGCLPDYEKKVFLYQNYITEGKNIELNKFQILLGERGAKKLNVKVQDIVRLSTVIDKKDQNGKIKHINQLIELTVAGIINTPNPKINENIGFIPLDILQDEMGLLLEGNISEICIRKKDFNPSMLPDKKDSVDVVKNILSKHYNITEYNITQNNKNKRKFQQEKFGNCYLINNDLILVDWKEDVKDYIVAARGDKTGSYLTIIFLFILSFFAIANTMLMAVMERTKEIGMIRSLGMTDFEIQKLFLYESFLIGVIGSFFGVLIGCLLNLYMVNYGIDFSDMINTMNGDFGYRISGVFKSSWNWTTIFLSGIVASLISSLTSILPARKALKISIVEALRFE